MGASAVTKVTLEKNYTFPMEKVVCAGKEFIYYGNAEGNIEVREVTSGQKVPQTGQWVYYQGLLYPRKGFPFPEALVAINLVKRVAFSALTFLAQKELALAFLGIAVLPWKFKKRIIQAVLNQIHGISEPVLAPFVLQDTYYSKFSSAARQFVQTFLGELGFNLIESVAETVAMIFEFDSAYCLRFQDLLSETSAEGLISNPRKELDKLFEIFKQREPRIRLVKSFGQGILGLKLILMIPKFRRAFNKALLSVNFKDLTLDETDRYHCLFTDGYDFMGRSIEDRQAELASLHGGSIPQGVEVVGS